MKPTVGMRNKTKHYNPAVRELTVKNTLKKAMNEGRENGIEYATIIYNLLLIMVLCDKTSMSDDEITHVLKNLDSICDSILQRYLTIPDIIKCLKEEHNFEMPEEKLIKFYPELEGYLTPDNSSN